jgi:hypothetical protein
MSTSGLAKRSAAQPSTRYRGTVTNNCRPNSQAAVCSDTPLLAMMGMICTVAPASAIRRNAVPTVRCQKAQECNVWPRLYSSGGCQAGVARRWRRTVAGRPGSCVSPGGSPSIVRPRRSGVSVIQNERGTITASRTRPMTVAVICQPHAAIARATPPTSTAGTKESIA